MLESGHGFPLRALRADNLAELENVPASFLRLTDAEASEAQCLEISIFRKTFSDPVI
jgi:hypothetical protein